jgi:ferredoxin
MIRIEKIWVVCFSPCGSTRKIAETLAGYIDDYLKTAVETVDYTLPPARNKNYVFADTDLVVWASPVYAGRLPNKLLPFIRSNFKGGGTPAIPVAVFGNRSYDDALVEMRNELEGSGFHTLAGAAVAAQHVFSDRLAAGRPDASDFERLKEFAGEIIEKLRNEAGPFKPFHIKGTNPPAAYYAPKGADGRPVFFLKAKPRTDEEKCVRCGGCARNCPMGAIDLEKPAEITGTCIKCHACIRKCARKAKYFDDAAFLSHKAMLEENFARRAEPEFFL